MLTVKVEAVHRMLGMWRNKSKAESEKFIKLKVERENEERKIVNL